MRCSAVFACLLLLLMVSESALLLLLSTSLTSALSFFSLLILTEVSLQDSFRLSEPNREFEA